MSQNRVKIPENKLGLNPVSPLLQLPPLPHPQPLSERTSTEGEVSNSSNSPDERSGTLALTDGEVLGETDALELTDGDKLGDAPDEAV